MALNKNNKEMVVVNFKEVPETICVETRFITYAAAKQKKNEQVFYISNKNGQMELTYQDDKQASIKTNTSVAKNHIISINMQSKQPQLQAAPKPPPLTQMLPSQAVPGLVPITPVLTNLNNKEVGLRANTNILGNVLTGTTTPVSTVAVPFCSTSHLQKFNLNTSVPVNSLGNTNSSNITSCKRLFRDQIQQTEVTSLNTKSVAIQCELSEELNEMIEWPEILEEPLENSLNPHSENETFLQFVKENSLQYKNYRECLICGEVSKKLKYFYGHMTIHRGPKVLCFKCGRYLDNEALLHNHYCEKSKEAHTAYLHCPYYSCGVVAISRLELFDHINEHVNNRMYKCSACQKAFYTCQEFVRHLLIRAKCYTSAKRTLFRGYGLESPKDRLCRVRVFTLHTNKKCTTLVKSFLSQRVPKCGVCKICFKSFGNKFTFKRHRVKCVAKLRKRLKRKRDSSLNL